MTARPHVRRPLVVLGVILTLVAAAGTVRAASIWVATTASLASPPTSMTSIEDALTQEQARSADLQQQLDALRSSSGDLSAALVAANQQVTTDQATADSLRSSLKAVQDKLAKAEAALRAAQAAAAAATNASKPKPTSTPPPWDDDGGDD